MARKATQPTKKTPATRKPGRPAKTVTEAQLRAIEKAAADGVREATIATLCGIAPRTWTDLKARDPRVSAALEKGTSRLEREIGSAFRQKVRDRDLGAMIWLEKTRFGRRESSVVQTQVLPPVRVTRG